jgi:hypothetical protein
MYHVTGFRVENNLILYGEYELLVSVAPDSDRHPARQVYKEIEVTIAVDQLAIYPRLR